MYIALFGPAPLVNIGFAFKEEVGNPVLAYIRCVLERR